MTVARIGAKERGRRAHASGDQFESMLDEIHGLYIRQGRAHVVKNQQPYRMLGGTDKGGTFRACFEGEGPPDYTVLTPGVAIVLEAKRTQQKRWGFHLLKDHQAGHLDQAVLVGAIGAVIVRFAREGRSVLLLWSELRRLWHPWRLGTAHLASLSYLEAVEHACWDGSGTDYLTGLLAHESLYPPVGQAGAFR